MTSPPAPAPDVAALLARLVDVLVAEQEAIRALDASRLGALAVDKERLGGALREAGPGAIAAARRAPGGGHVRALAARAQALSHANRLLIEEAARAVGRRLGLVDAGTPGTYDARARRVSSAPLTPGRRI